jgi:hypothetical protein
MRETMLGTAGQGGHPMRLSKEQVVRFIRARGDEEHASKAEQELPDSMELPEDQGLLAQYGVQADDLDDESVWGR